MPRRSLYSSVAERQSCKLKVLGSIPSGGFRSPGSRSRKGAADRGGLRLGGWARAARVEKLQGLGSFEQPGATGGEAEGGG